MSPEEEISHWKNAAEDYRRQYEEVKEELEEFQMGSRELELELEVQLEQMEKRYKELNSTHETLRVEYDSLREKTDRDRENLTLQLTHVQDEYSRIKAERDDMHRYIRDLEQVNDDLERTKRSTVVSLEDFEGRLNQAIERNAFLESELDEKEMLVETVQRLKDEARDLRQELDVVKQDDEVDSKWTSTAASASGPAPALGPDSGPQSAAPRLLDAATATATSSSAAAAASGPSPPPVPTAASLAASRQLVESHAQTDHIDSNRLSELPVTPISLTRQRPAGAGTPASPGGGGGSGGAPLTPSMRISALNLVSDLLRKVGALETKLASCRSYSREGRAASLRQAGQMNGSLLNSSLASPPPSAAATASGSGSVASVVARGKPLVRDSPVKVSN